MTDRHKRIHTLLAIVSLSCLLVTLCFFGETTVAIACLAVSSFTLGLRCGKNLWTHDKHTEAAKNGKQES